MYDTATFDASQQCCACKPCNVGDLFSSVSNGKTFSTTLTLFTYSTCQSQNILLEAQDVQQAQTFKIGSGNLSFVVGRFSCNETICIDDDFSTDSQGNPCVWYQNTLNGQQYCGDYDWGATWMTQGAGGFNASDQCCACGGGTQQQKQGLSHQLFFDSSTNSAPSDLELYEDFDVNGNKMVYVKPKETSRESCYSFKIQVFDETPLVVGVANSNTYGPYKLFVTLSDHVYEQNFTCQHYQATDSNFLSSFLEFKITACAQEGEFCKCAYGNIIWYGLADLDGNLDTTKNFTRIKSEAQQTICEKSSFGGYDPVEDNIKSCWCQNFISVSYPPTFSEELQSKNVFIDFLNETNQWEFQLPLIEDPDNDFSTISIDSHVLGSAGNSIAPTPQANLVYIQETNVIQVRFKTSLYNRYLGNHLLKIMLYDLAGNENTYFLGVSIGLLDLADQSEEQSLDTSMTGSETIQTAQIEPAPTEQSEWHQEDKYIFEQEVQNFSEDEVQIVSAELRKVAQYGLTEIKFNRKMNTEFIDIKDINKTLLDLYVKPFQDWHLEETDFEVEPNLNFTWQVVEYKEDRMLIQLKFKHPLQISPKTSRDDLVLHFRSNATQFFISKDSLEIHPEYHTLSKDIPKQLSENLLALNGSSSLASQVVQNTLLMTTALAPISTGPIFYIIAMINQLQLVMHLPMLNLPVPANIFLLQQFLVKVVTFDVVQDKYKDMFRHILRGGKDPLREGEEDVDDIPAQVQELGYESHFIDNNMDLVVFAIMVWAFRVFMYWAVMPMFIWLLSKTHNEEIKPDEVDSDSEQENSLPKNQNQEDSKSQEAAEQNETENKEGGNKENLIETFEKDSNERKQIEEPRLQKAPRANKKKSLAYKAHVFCLKRRLYLNRQIFFNEILIIFIEAYLEFSVSFTLQVRSTEKWVAIFIGIAIFMIVPASIIYTACLDQQTLDSNQYQRRFGAIYLNLKTNHPSQVLHTFSFVLRRLVFVLLTQKKYMRAHVSISLVLLAAFFFLVGIYHGYVMPYECPKINKIELVNEMFFGMHLYLTMCYTDFVTTPTAQFQAGWIHIYVLLTQLIFNLVFLFQDLLNTLRLCVIKFYNWVMDDPIGRENKRRELKRSKRLSKKRNHELEKIVLDSYKKEMERLKKLDVQGLRPEGTLTFTQIQSEAFGISKIGVAQDNESNDSGNEQRLVKEGHQEINQTTKISMPQIKDQRKECTTKQRGVENLKIDDFIKEIEDYDFDPENITFGQNQHKGSKNQAISRKESELQTKVLETSGTLDHWNKPNLQIESNNQRLQGQKSNDASNLLEQIISLKSQDLEQKKGDDMIFETSSKQIESRQTFIRSKERSPDLADQILEKLEKQEDERISDDELEDNNLKDLIIKEKLNIHNTQAIEEPIQERTRLDNYWTENENKHKQQTEFSTTEKFSQLQVQSIKFRVKQLEELDQERNQSENQYTPTSKIPLTDQEKPVESKQSLIPLVQRAASHRPEFQVKPRNPNMPVYEMKLDPVGPPKLLMQNSLKRLKQKNGLNQKQTRQKSQKEIEEEKEMAERQAIEELKMKEFKERVAKIMAKLNT